MKIVFAGVLTDTKGCGACGKASRTRLKSVKRYYLPSGQEKVFRLGIVEEINDDDGVWLLENAIDTKTNEHCFKEVKDND